MRDILCPSMGEVTQKAGSRPVDGQRQQLAIETCCFLHHVRERGSMAVWLFCSRGISALVPRAPRFPAQLIPWAPLALWRRCSAPRSPGRLVGESDELYAFYQGPVIIERLGCCRLTFLPRLRVDPCGQSSVDQARPGSLFVTVAPLGNLAVRIYTLTAQWWPVALALLDLAERMRHRAYSQFFYPAC